MIHLHGLEDYYRIRDTDKAPAAQAEVKGGGYETFDSDAFQQEHCQSMSGSTSMPGDASMPDGERDTWQVVDFRLQGIHCAACIWLVERLPQFVPGVISSRLNLRDAVVRVTWNRSVVQLSAIAVALDRLGYPPHPASDISASEVRRRDERTQLIRLGVAGACAGNTMLLALALYAGDHYGIEGGFALYVSLVECRDWLGGARLAWLGVLSRSLHGPSHTHSAARSTDCPRLGSRRSGWFGKRSCGATRYLFRLA